LTILLCDQETGRILRLSRELTLINVLHTDNPDLRLRPTRAASIDERTIVLLDGPTSHVVRWTTDRGVDQRFGTTVGIDAPAAPTDIAADVRSVYVADAASGCLFVYDSMGSFIGRIACEPGSAIVAVNISAGRLWTTRRVDMQTKTRVDIEAWLVDGTRAARYSVPAGLEVTSAVGVAGQIWILTPSGLFVSGG